MDKEFSLKEALSNTGTYKPLPNTGADHNSPPPVSNYLQATVPPKLTPEQFAYWLKGFAEVAGTAPTPEQWNIICEHLDMLFARVPAAPISSTPGQAIYPYPDTVMIC